MLHTLHLDIVGRNLPPGATIGERIITLRKRKGVSQRDLVKLVGVSQPTLIELERHATGRLQTLDRFLTILGAGAYLVPHGSTKAFYVHPGNSSTSANWETPQALLEPLYSMFGVFDLDPCSPTSNGHTAPVRANVHYTEDDDGLSLPWFGTVYMNPPYGRSLSQWTAKAKAEVEQGNAEIVVGLLPARPDTSYWHRDIAGSASVCPDQSGLERGGLHWVTMPWQDSLRARPGHPTRAVPLGNTDHGINTILPYARDSMTAWCALAASASGNS